MLYVSVPNHEKGGGFCRGGLATHTGKTTIGYIMRNRNDAEKPYTIQKRQTAKELARNYT